MNVRILIDSIVRQTVVLIAQLATSGGLRAPLVHIAEQVFLELAQELERQGVPRKVSADMFGIALRTYQRRTQRIVESSTDRERSLWQAVFDYIREGEIVTRDDVLQRFRYDDEGSVRGVLRDLVESGLLFSTGSGRHVVYRLATDEETRMTTGNANGAGLEPFLWSVIFREGPLTEEALCGAVRLPRADVTSTLKVLVDDGRIERVETAGTVVYRSQNLLLGLEEPAGWEAAVLDHFVALARTIGRKLALAQRAASGDEVGGSTYHFSLWHGHPMQSEIVGELRHFRERMSALRSRVDHHNATHAVGAKQFNVTAYYGQYIQEEDDDAEP
jgi:hypothetical protein